MNQNPLSQGVLTDNFSDLGSVIMERVRARARELAQLAGRAVGHVTPADFELAKREFTDRPEQDPREALLESAPESDPWNPRPGSPGHLAPESPSEDGDEEGRSGTSRPVIEGVEEAGRGQMFSAVRQTGKKDHRSP